MISGILGQVVSERLLWLARADVVELAAPGAHGQDEIPRSAILWIESSRVLNHPVGRLTETRRDRHGNTSRSEYLVRPLVEGLDGPLGEPAELCWWVGTADSSFTMFQHPILSPNADSPYFVDNPTHRSDYEQAVANALGSGPLPACTRVLERVPHPDEIRSVLLSKLGRLALVVNGALWVLLGVWGVAWLVRRLKAAQADG